MTLLLVVLVLAIVVFFVAFVSPRKGTAAQKKSGRLLDALLRKLHKAPKWVQALTAKPPIYSHKTIHKSADLGKAARHKSEEKIVDPLKAKTGSLAKKSK